MLEGVLRTSVVHIAPGNILCHHSKYLMGYFEFLHGSRITCLPLNIPEKLHSHLCLRKTRKGRDSLPSSLLIRYNTHAAWRATSTTSLYHPDSNSEIGHVLVHFVDKTHVLVVTVELIWLLLLNIISFNFVPIPRKSLSFTRFRRSYVTPLLLF